VTIEVIMPVICTKALLPNKELYLEKTTLCREIERTRRLLESKDEVMKLAERLHSSSTIGKVLLRTGRKKECELHGRLRTRNISIKTQRKG